MATFNIKVTNTFKKDEPSKFRVHREIKHVRSLPELKPTESDTTELTGFRTLYIWSTKKGKPIKCSLRFRMADSGAFTNFPLGLFFDKKEKKWAIANMTVSLINETPKNVNVNVGDDNQ